MADNDRPTVEYFSDVLCIWAYGAQARLDELKRNYAERVVLRYRFIPLFAAARSRIEAGWGNRGGFKGFNRHVREVAASWDHLTVHPEVWLRAAPVSSSVAHLFLKTVQLLQQRKLLPCGAAPPHGRDLFEETVWQVRRAFFERAEDVARPATLEAIAEDLSLPVDTIRALSASGEAHAALHLDLEARDRYRVQGSPTLILNEGRQHLYGNVGYRIIEANVRELLHNPGYGEATWC